MVRAISRRTPEAAGQGVLTGADNNGDSNSDSNSSNQRQAPATGDSA